MSGFLAQHGGGRAQMLALSVVKNIVLIFPAAFVGIPKKQGIRRMIRSEK